MINPLLVQEIFNSPLSIDPQYAQGLVMSAISSYFTKSGPFAIGGAGHGLIGDGVHQSSISLVPMCAFTPGSSIKQDSDFAPNSVAIISLQGPVVLNSDRYYGIKSTLDLAEEFLAVENHPNLIGSVFCNESGGGSVYAIKPLDDVLAGLTKPVVTFSKHVLASAAYRLSVRSKHIMMYHPHGIVGSLGTMGTFNDMQPMFEKWGMKFNEFYATLSSLKNKTYTDAKKGDGKALIANVLDPMNEDFLAEIQALRGEKIDSKEKTIYQGETYTATRGIELGLIDSLGDLQDAVNMVAEHASKKSKHSTSHTNNNLNMNFPQLLSLKGKDAPTQAELDAANAELTEAGITGVGIFPESVVTEASEATTLAGTLKTQLDAANQELTTVKGENASLKAKIAQAPAAVAPVVPPADPRTEKTAAELADEKVSGFAHNRYVDEMLNY